MCATTAPCRTPSTRCRRSGQQIDVLVNNAGLSRGLDKLYMGKVEDWDEMIDTNVKGLLYVSRAVVPGMVVRGRGHVVNLGSTAGEITYPNGAVYCASKAAERAINDGLRQDVLGTPVRVTSIDPGMVETDFSLVRFHGDEERAAKVYKGLTPLTPEDVAEAIVWAASRPAHVNIARVMLDAIAPGQLAAVSPRAVAPDRKESGPLAKGINRNAPRGVRLVHGLNLRLNLRQRCLQAPCGAPGSRSSARECFPAAG